MSNKVYNILWVDDEHEDMPAFKRLALDFDLKLVPFKSLDAGMAELERNLVLYDSVLLDAKFFEKEDDVADTEDTDYVHRAKERILQLPKKFDIHILTGQAEAFDSSDFKKAFKKVFKKGISEDVEALFNNLKVSAEGQLDFQIRNEYKRVFEIGNEKYLGSKIYEPISNLLKQIKTTNDFEPTKDNLLPLRKIIENSFDILFELSIIPEEIYKTGLNPTVKFLCNNRNNSGYSLVKDFMHPSMAYFFDNLVFITQDSQHDKKGLKLNVDEYISNIKSPYLFKSLVFQLLDYLIWLKQFIDENPNRELNANLWIKDKNIEIATNESYRMGQLEQDEKGHYHIGEYVLQYRKIHGNYDIGDKLEITKSIENTSTTKDKYPFFAISFKQI
ncbi:hypothetical protein [Flavobacterium algoritolerans]|uniref:Response regulator n=1 Tax=Flavobacterium algoritolerans TaxID=3041254 RepID=A0ABT6VEZ2_9FLAO|nr:hypothetical protein [Flavobacterium algoritolerans]MDI5895744.1 hypothetical protein [Flavobacterium algoritolerans]